MRQRIKILYHLQNMGFGAYIHSVRNTIINLDLSEFEPFLASVNVGACKEEFVDLLDTDHTLFYEDKDGMLCWDAKHNRYPDAIDTHILYDLVNNNDIDILHDSTAGCYCFPLNSPHMKCKKLIVNVFGEVGAYGKVDYTVCISQGVYNTLKHRTGNSGATELPQACVIPIPINQPEAEDNLRNELGISENTTVVGRVANPWGDSTTNFKAYAKAETPSTLLLVAGEYEGIRQRVKDLGIKNYMDVPAITSRKRMSQFYRTLDILAHCRGESFGAAVAEAMMHGVPVITQGWSNGVYHDSNAQEELIQDRSFCAEGNNESEYIESYANILKRLVEKNREEIREIGKAFRDRVQYTDSAKVTRQFENVYRKLVA